MKPVNRCLALALAIITAAPAQARDLDSFVGKAMTLSYPVAIGRLFIADPAIASAAARGNTLWFSGKAAGNTSYSVSDGRGNVIDSGILHIAYDAPSLEASLAAALPGSAIRVTTARDVLILSGTVPSAAEGDDAARLAARFVPGGDSRQVLNRMAVTAPMQINLQVRVAEVSREVVKALGFNWQAVGGIGNALLGLATGNPVLGGITPPGFNTRANGVDSLFASFRQGKVDLNVLIDALSTRGLVTMLAEPNLTALSGQPASFLAGGEYPIPVPQSMGVTTIEYKRFGVSLAFVATVGANGRITLNVRPEVSQLTSNGALSFNGATVPALTTRRAETTVELGSGQGFAIAGLLQTTKQDDLRKLPFLGDIPVLGQLFRSKRYERHETELVILVTPYLVQPVAAAALTIPKGIEP